MALPSTKTVYGIDCENLNLYFEKQLPLITPQAKEGLPKDVAFKLFRKGGEVNSKSTSKLSFLAKLHILWKACRKNIFIVIEGDDRNGLTIEDFVSIKQAVKVRDYSIDRVNEYLTPQATFVTGGKDLMQSLAYLNNLSTSPAYNYLLRGKNPVANKVEQNKKATEYICRFLANYEGSRKKIGYQTGVSISEWMVLIYLYSGKEVESNTIWKDVYQYSYNSSKTKLKLAFGTLQNRGYITKYGTTKGAKMQITAYGIEAVNTIIEKFVVNC